MSNKKWLFLILLINLLFTNLSAQTNQWRLIWNQNPPEDTVSSYRVYRDSTGESITESNYIDSVDTSQYPDTVYVDSTISKGVLYFYKLKAVNRYGMSVFSDSARAAIPKIITNEIAGIVNDGILEIQLDDEDIVIDPDDALSSLTYQVDGDTIDYAIYRINFDDNTSLDSVLLRVTDPSGFYDEKSVMPAISNPPPPHLEKLLSR